VGIIKASTVKSKSTGDRFHVVTKRRDDGLFVTNVWEVNFWGQRIKSPFRQFIEKIAASKIPSFLKTEMRFFTVCNTVTKEQAVEQHAALVNELKNSDPKDVQHKVREAIEKRLGF